MTANRSQGSTPVRLGRGTVVTRSDRAVLVTIAKRRTWLPLAAVHRDSDVPKEEVGEVIVCAWFARSRGWL